MPIVPVLNNEIRLQAAPNIQRQPLRSTVGESLGHGLGETGNLLVQIHQQESLKADQTALMDASRKTDTVANVLTTNAQRRVLKDAIGVAPEVVSDFDKQTKEIEQGLKNDRQKRAYREAVNQRRSQLQRSVENHESQQTEAYYAKSREDYKDQAHLNAVANYQDPKAVENEIANVRSAINQTPGLDESMKATELNVRRAGIYQAVMDRYLANDQIKQAESYYAAVKGQLGDKAARVENALIDAKARVASAQKAAAVTAQASRVLTRYASDGPEAGSALLSQLAKKLPTEVMGEVYTKVQAGLGHARNAKQEEHADELAGIYQSISAGTAGPEQIASVEKLWNDNAFTPTERASLIGRIETTQVAHAKDAAAAAVIRESLASGIPLDPSNSEQKKALSSLFAEDAREAPVGSPQWQGLAVAYAARTRMLPEQATSWVRSAIRSPDAAVAAPAAQFLGAVQAAAGDASSGFDKDTKAFAGMVSSMIDAGTPPEKAIETARQTVYELKPAIVEQRKTEYRDAAKESNGALNSLIDRDMDTWLTSQPGPTAALQVDFSSQAQQYYLKTGDLGLSRELAWQDLQRVYGVTEVNGVKQVMAAPPERFGLKPEDVRKDIGDFLSAHPQSDGSTAEEVTLVPDALTLRATASIMDGKRQSPSYKLITKSGDLVIDEKGIPVRYTLPSGDDLAAQIKTEQDTAAEAARKQVEQAKFDRDTKRRRQEALELR